MDVTPSEFASLRSAARASVRKAGATDLWVDEIADEALSRLLVQDPPPEKPRAWVRHVAKNLTIDARRRDPAGGWGDMPLTNPGLGERPYPEHLWNASLTGQARDRLHVEEVLAVLTESEQKLLVGAAAGMSTKELAERYGYTPGSVRTMISNARKRIRKAFPDRADFD